MVFKVTTLDKVARIEMAGRFDFQIHREFKGAYDKFLDETGIVEVEIELSQVSYLDSSALGMLMLLNKRAHEKNKTVTLLNPSPGVAQVLEVANFNKLFNIKQA
ncbi:MAG: STAS domain-containing protein [Nitrosomonadales bacterium]|nr:STAS domain-containing protein [Nitrosomonadales bacterium]